MTLIPHLRRVCEAAKAMRYLPDNNTASDMRRALVSAQFNEAANPATVSLLLDVAEAAERAARCGLIGPDAGTIGDALDNALAALKDTPDAE